MIKLISGNVMVRAVTAKFLGSCTIIGQIQCRTRFVSAGYCSCQPRGWSVSLPSES
jgi:hypothetical protein